MDQPHSTDQSPWSRRQALVESTTLDLFLTHLTQLSHKLNLLVFVDFTSLQVIYLTFLESPAIVIIGLEVVTFLLFVNSIRILV